MLGVHSLSEAEETKQTFDIMELYNHPDFKASNYDNDIALIKVSAVLKCKLLRCSVCRTSQQQNYGY